MGEIINLQAPALNLLRAKKIARRGSGKVAAGAWVFSLSPPVEERARRGYLFKKR